MNDDDAAQIVHAVAEELSVYIVYHALNGIVSSREIRPNSVRRCMNGRTIVHAHDVSRNAPRSFILANILAVSATEPVISIERRSTDG